MPETLQSLPVLLARVREGDDVAAGELVEHLYPLAAQIVRANLPRRVDAEDLVQEVFLKMFSRLEQFRGEVPLEHWFSRIAVNTCLDHLRRQKVRPELRWADLTEEEQAALEMVAHQQENAPEADAAQALALFNRLLESLPAQDAWLLREVELERRPLADICAEAGWNSGATRVRLFRARHRLQKLFRGLESKS